MRWTLRTKLMAIAATTAVAFGALIVTGEVISRRLQNELVRIEGLYLPKLELGPRLEKKLVDLARALQDAVAAKDPEALTETEPLERALLAEVDRGADVLGPEPAASLHRAIEVYFGEAQSVSRRLMAGETGETLLEAIGGMQDKQHRAMAELKSATEVDRGALREAFAAAATAQSDASSLRLAVSAVCMLLVLLLLGGLSRGLLRALAGLTDGLERFGQGQFDRQIRLAVDDELGAVARRANAMAANLQRLDLERAQIISRTQDLLAETQAQAGRLTGQERELRVINGELTAQQQELEAFSYSVAHDLRAPLRGMNGFSQILLTEHGAALNEEGKDCLQEIASNATRMALLIDGLLSLSRVTRTDLKPEPVDFSQLAKAAVARLAADDPARRVEVVIQPGLLAQADSKLALALIDNLIGNAWKFTRSTANARIEVGLAPAAEGPVYFVRDNGAGFDMAYANKLFAPFQRLHSEREFPGTGIGLATVQRIVRRHGGRIWAEGIVGAGATFRFTLSPSLTGAAQ